MVVDINNIRNNYESRDYNLVIATDDMVSSVLGSLEERLREIGCSFYWVSNSEISLVKEAECKGYYDNSHLESLLSESYDEFVENLEKEEDDGISDEEIEDFIDDLENNEVFNSKFLNNLVDELDEDI